MEIEKSGSIYQFEVHKSKKGRGLIRPGSVIGPVVDRPAVVRWQDRNVI